VRRLSVAVLVDGVYTPDQNGDLVYAPRSAEELERIALLVRSAVGYDEGRGDTVEVVNLRFAQAHSVLAEDEAGLFEFTRADIMRFIELGVLFLIALLLTLFAVRPLIKRILSVEEKEQPALLTADGQPVEGAMIAAQSAEAAGEVDEDGEPRIEWLEEAQAQGAVQIATIARSAD
jgi:flagellar M-ring protein FliF